MVNRRAMLLLALLGLGHGVLAAFEPPGLLEIHYINVGQGGSTLIIGPDGTRILYDFGNTGSDKDIVWYLRSQLKLDPAEGLHYTVVSHRDKDHYAGYRGVIQAGYEVLNANYGSGSRKRASKFMKKRWLDPAKGTQAGEARPIPVGKRVPLGDTAELVVVVANGKVMGIDEPFPVPNENDRSVALFIHYRHFHYILDGDLGSGSERCTKRQTRQKDLQTHVAKALLREGLMHKNHGVDVLHIAHHGSESSTSAAYYKLTKTVQALISVGRNQGRFRHPRQDVVGRVLLNGGIDGEAGKAFPRAACVSTDGAPPLQALFQTEQGIAGCSSTGCTSFQGEPAGDIVLRTDGENPYTITGTHRERGTIPSQSIAEEDFGHYTMDTLKSQP